MNLSNFIEDSNIRDRNGAKKICTSSRYFLILATLSQLSKHSLEVNGKRLSNSLLA